MNRRDTVFGLAALGVASLAAHAQQPRKVWRIGFLGGANRPADGLPPAPLRKGLAALGYVEGSNIMFEVRWAEAKFERLPALVAELIERHVDAIVVGGWLPTQAVKRATSTIPIIAMGVGDAVESGLVASLARPGGNLTGVSDSEAELSAKRLQLLKEAVPKALRIAVMWNQDDLGMTLRYRQIDIAASKLGVSVQALGVREPDDFGAAFSAMTRERPDALFLVTDALTGLNRKRVIEFAAQHRIPAMYENGSYVQDGGLLSYGSSPADNFARVAYFLDRIMKGAKPADLPMEQPTRYYMYVNLKTAKAFDFSVPHAIMLRADTVIE